MMVVPILRPGRPDGISDGHYAGAAIFDASKIFH